MNRLANILAIAALVSLAGCDQRPVDVAPDTGSARWVPAIDMERPSGYYAVAGLGKDDLYIVAADELVHFDGTDVTPVYLPSNEPVTDVAADPAGGLLVARPTAVDHFNGGRFVRLAEFQNENVYGISGASDGSIVAVSRGKVVRFDGVTWFLEYPGPDVSVRAVWGSSARDVYAGTAYDGLYHFDGSGWSAVAAMAMRVDGLWGTSPDDVFAVTGMAVYHYDGASWMATTLSNGYLDRPWGLGPDDVYITGYGGVVHHYDGNSWTTTRAATSVNLRRVWASAPDDVYAVGDYGKIVRFDGTSWRSVRGGAPGSPYLAAGAGGDDVILVSYQGEALTALFRFDGSAFREEIIVGSSYGITDVWMSPGGDAVAVAGDGRVYIGEGPTWRTETTPAAYGLSAVWAAGGAVCAVGGDAVVLRKDGAWTLLRESTGVTYSDVWMSSDHDIFAAARGTVDHYRNGVWTRTVLDDHWRVHVWGARPDDVFAVSEFGAAFHFDGARWTRSPLPRESGYAQWWSIAGGAAGNVYALGGDDVMHFDGAVWSMIGSRMVGPYIDRGWVGRSGELYGFDSSWPYVYRLEVTR